MASPMEIAQGLVGRGEVPDRAAIQDYLRTGGANLDPVTTAWCAAFVNSSLAQGGFKGTGSNLARSFLSYGAPVSQPQRGDIAVFTRGDPKGPYGHAGFFDSVNPDGTIKILSGNWDNAVAYGNMPADALLGYRRPNAAQAAPAMDGAGAAAASAKGSTPGTGPQQDGRTPLQGLADMFGPALMQNQQRTQQAQLAQQAEQEARRQALFSGPNPFPLA